MLTLLFLFCLDDSDNNLTHNGGCCRGMEKKENLNNFIVGDLPTLIYIPDFITDSEQAQLLNNVFISLIFSFLSLLFFLRLICLPSFFVHTDLPSTYIKMEIFEE